MFWKEVLGLYETFEEADAAEQDLIRRCYKTDPLCLNENCGGAVSPELCKTGGQRGGNTNKQSGQAYEWGKKYGRIAVESGQLAEARKCIDRDKQRAKASEVGKINGRKAVESGQFKDAQEKGWESTRERHQIKNAEGKSILAVSMGLKGGILPWWNNGQTERRSFDCPGPQFNPGRLPAPESTREAARVMANTKWMDPDHPELGVHNAGVLVRKQRKLGLPSEKENRKKVG
jgi:hypothetical protein